LRLFNEKAGRHKESVKHLKKAIELNPSYMEASCYLVAVYDSLGKQEEAQKELQVLRDSGFNLPPGLVQKSDSPLAASDLEALRRTADRKSSYLMHMSTKVGTRLRRHQLQAQNFAIMTTCGFFDDELNRLLQIDGVDEAVLYGAFLGARTTSPAT